jgi:hypothetical protein
VKPAFGWTLLSKEALKRAEAQIREDMQGVRDEVGFLSVHQAYADRFFPGTSVLHTRLRYVLFVPWLYQRIMQRRDRRRVDAILQQEEIALAGRLNKSKEHGVIGGRSYPKPTTQPPSLNYWTALAAWGLLRPLPSGGHPSRSQVHRAIAGRSDGLRLQDDDKQLLEEDGSLFSAVPNPPDDWDDSAAPLTFDLSAPETDFLGKRLISVGHPLEEDGRSLLSCLAETTVSSRTELTDAKVSRAAIPADREPLERAGQAAALAGIGRGIYAALVEAACDREDGLPVGSDHRDHLEELIATHRAEARALDLDALRIDAGNRLPEGIVTVLAATQEWLARSSRSIEDLHEVYERAERRRKGRRARLPQTFAAKEKRAEWAAEAPPLAAPLHFRWGNVRQLLLDLQGAS